MPTKKQFHTRLDEDDAAALKKYQDSRNLTTTAEAVRRLIQAGLEAETEDEDTPSRDEIAADLDEVRESVRGIHDEVADEDGRTHTMHQANATTIGSVAVSIATAALAINYLPALGAFALVALLVVGVGLIAYGIAPAVRAARDTASEDDSQEVPADA